MRAIQVYDEFSDDMQNLFWVIMKELERDVEVGGCGHFLGLSK